MSGHGRIAFRIVILATVALTLPALARGAAGVVATDTVWTIAGGGHGEDGVPATLAVLDRPRHVSQAADGSLFVAEPFRSRVRKISPSGMITTFAGTGEAGFSGDGSRATAARLNLPHAVVPLSDGSVIIADTGNGRIRKVLPNGTIVTAAENLGGPRNVAGLPDSGFLIPDTSNHCIRQVDTGGAMTTVAGTCGARGFAGDGGPATAALLNAPFSVEPVPGGGFLVADIGNQRIRRVDASGTITTVAGNGSTGYAGDGGPATAASLSDPHAVFPLPEGGFVIADTSASRVRMVNSSGTIITLAGTGAAAFSGDGGSVGEAALSSPKGVWVTRDGYLLIADERNGRIRAVGRPVVPRISHPPKVTGTATIFARLTASPGGWRATGGKLTTPGPSKFAYQWQRCEVRSRRCVNIGSASGVFYDTQPADVGWRLRVRVTATNPAGSASGSSAHTHMLAGANRAQPTLMLSSADGSVSRVYEANGRVTKAAVQTHSRDVVVARAKAGGTFVSVGLLRFDTSAIPESARITSVRLQFPVISRVSETGARLWVEPYPGSRWPIGRSDFANAPQRKPIADYDLNWLQSGQTADITLPPSALDPGKASAAFRLLIPEGTTPGTNVLKLAAADHRTLSGAWLLVEYAAP